MATSTSPPAPSEVLSSSISPVGALVFAFLLNRALALQNGIQRINMVNRRKKAKLRLLLLEQLKRYGAAGVLSYRLHNIVYYVTTFLLVWFHFSPAPGRMGYAATVERFLKLMAMLWAGSQVTKILLAGGALALAPLVDRGVRWFTVKFNFQSEGKAFATIVGLCFALAALMFAGLTVL
ncbi:uncharacterized protein [Triticum aestivum]|uniref:uncharacterized protein n=1 Tax=Triticum aestivum TaxID=4565 RepID=UPI001D022C07|nr:uncharacterized protein LOC123114789 [Triticum aestivum]